MHLVALNDKEKIGDPTLAMTKTFSEPPPPPRFLPLKKKFQSSPQNFCFTIPTLRGTPNGRSLILVQLFK